MMRHALNLIQSTHDSETLTYHIGYWYLRVYDHIKKTISLFICSNLLQSDDSFSMSIDMF